MKTPYTLFLFLLFFCSAINAQNPVPNPGFESWVINPTIPDSWYSNNVGVNVLVTQTSGNTGNYGVQGDVIIHTSGGIASPYFACNFPVTQIYNSMQFYYKANLDSGDMFQFSCAIYDTAGAFMASNFGNIDTSTSNFTLFTMNINSLNTGVIDHALITFSIVPASPNPTAHDASYFVVDDVELFSGTSGIKSMNETENITLFPNPASDKFIVTANLPGERIVHIALFNSTGRLIINNQTAALSNGRLNQKINIENINSGIYILKITGENKTYVKKMVIE